MKKLVWYKTTQYHLRHDTKTWEKECSYLREKPINEIRGATKYVSIRLNKSEYLNYLYI